MHYATTLDKEKKDTAEVYLKALTEFALLLLRVNDKPSWFSVFELYFWTDMVF